MDGNILLVLLVWIVGIIGILAMRKAEPDNIFYPIWVAFICVMLTIAAVVVSGNTL